ncbi:MAG: hypothetical protein ABI685_03235 [Ferruginibacter sp.]
MKKIIPALVLLSLVFAACGGGKDVKVKDKYEQTKITLGETEKKNPKLFLSVAETDKKNFLGKTVIKVDITNKATVASFKDVDIELSFYSQTGALLERDHEVIYETIAPGSTINHKTRYKVPKHTDRVEVKIAGAKTD